MSEAASVPAETSSRWEDLIDVFVAPARLFRRRMDGKFGHALLVLIVLSGVLFYGTKPAMQPILDAEFAKGVAAALKRNPNYTAEQAERFRSIGEAVAGVTIVVGMAVAVFVAAALVWLASRAVGGAINYAQATVITTFAFFPRLIDTIARAVQALLMDESRLTSMNSVSVGVGRFLDPAAMNPLAFALLARIDLFVLWGTALIAVGIRQMARVSTARAVMAAGIIWLIGVVPYWLQAMRAG